jgi:hypothetical protein
MNHATMRKVTALLMLSFGVVVALSFAVGGPDSSCDALIVELSHEGLDGGGLPVTLHLAVTNRSAYTVVGGNARMEFLLGDAPLGSHAVASDPSWAEFRVSPGGRAIFTLPFASLIFIDSHGSRVSRDASAGRLRGRAWSVRARVSDETGHDPAECSPIVHVNRPGRRFALYYDASDGLYSWNNPKCGTLFKDRAAALAVRKVLGGPARVLKCTTKRSKGKRVFARLLE